MHIHIELTVNEALELLNQKPQLFNPLAQLAAPAVQEALEVKPVEPETVVAPEKPVEPETVVAPEKPVEAKPKRSRKLEHAAPTPAEPTPVAEPTPAVVEASVTPTETTSDTNPTVGTLTLDDVRASAIRFANNNGIDKFKAVLERFGVQSVSSLKPEQFGAFKTEVEK